MALSVVMDHVTGREVGEGESCDRGTHWLPWPWLPVAGCVCLSPTKCLSVSMYLCPSPPFMANLTLWHSILRVLPLWLHFRAIMAKCWDPEIRSWGFPSWPPLCIFMRLDPCIVSSAEKHGRWRPLHKDVPEWNTEWSSLRLRVRHSETPEWG